MNKEMNRAMNDRLAKLDPVVCRDSEIERLRQALAAKDAGIAAAIQEAVEEERTRLREQEVEPLMRLIEQRIHTRYAGVPTVADCEATRAAVRAAQQSSAEGKETDRTCEYCGCRTNARIRACCGRGRNDDQVMSAVNSIRAAQESAEAGKEHHGCER